MIHTRICDLLGIDHPIVLGGMGSATTATLVAAVSNAGGFGTLGTSAFNAATLENEIAAIHERTEKPFGINHDNAVDGGIEDRLKNGFHLAWKLKW